MSLESDCLYDYICYNNHQFFKMEANGDSYFIDKYLYKREFHTIQWEHRKQHNGVLVRRYPEYFLLDHKSFVIAVEHYDKKLGAYLYLMAFRDIIQAHQYLDENSADMMNENFFEIINLKQTQTNFFTITCNRFSLLHE